MHQDSLRLNPQPPGTPPAPAPAPQGYGLARLHCQARSTIPSTVRSLHASASAGLPAPPQACCIQRAVPPEGATQVPRPPPLERESVNPDHQSAYTSSSRSAKLAPSLPTPRIEVKRMKTRRTRRKQYRTVWHPIFYTLVRGTLPGIYRMLIELLLGEMPPRADLVIIRREPGAPPPDDELEELPALYTRLGEHTLVEFKGGTDRVEARDVAIVLGYANLYLAKHHLSLEQLRLIFVGPRLKESFLHGVESRGGSLVRTLPPRLSTP